MTNSFAALTASKVYRSLPTDRANISGLNEVCIIQLRVIGVYLPSRLRATRIAILVTKLFLRRCQDYAVAGGGAIFILY